MDQVRDAVLALYSSDLSQQAQANQWLTAFQQTEAAWEAGLTLLAGNQSPELQFFAATLLVRKVRNDWSRLEGQKQHLLLQAFRNKLDEVLSWPAASSLVSRLVCVLMAAVTGAMGGTGATDVVSLAFSLAGRSPELCFELLAALAQEQEDLDRIHRSGLVKQLLACSKDVYNLLGSSLPAAMNTGQTALATAILKTAGEWLRLNPVAGSGCMTTPGDVLALYPDFFSSILSVLSSQPGNDDATIAAGHALLLLFSSTAVGQDESRDLPAFSELVRALTLIQPSLPHCNEAVAVIIGQLGSAAAERSPEICCGQIQEAVPFASLMLDCLLRREPSVVESCLEYFLMMNTVPLSERVSQLGTPLYEAMLHRLVSHTSYPSSFVSWEEEDTIDADDFKRLRTDVLPEALEVAYGLLKYSYLAYAWQLLQEAKNWQTAEAALYLVAAVALAVKSRLLGDAAQQPGPAAENATLSAQLLVNIFGEICSQGRAESVLSSHPALASTACMLIERYATWFAKTPAAPLQDALSFLLKAIEVAGVGSAAAKAFHTMCLRCGGALKEASAVDHLTGVLHASFASVDPRAATGQLRPRALSLDDWQAVAGGIARLAFQLSSDQSGLAIRRLTDPYVAAAKAAAGSPGASRQAAINNLGLLSACLAHMCTPADADPGSLPQISIVSASAAGGLDIYASQPVWQQDEQVAAAVVEVYKQAVCSAKKGGRELLPLVLPSLSTLFAATAQPACLDVLGEALELHFDNSGVVNCLLQATHEACSVAFPRLQGPGLRDFWPLTSSLLSLADTFVIYAPAALWSSPILLPLLQLAVATLSLREPDPVCHALGLLSHVTATHERAAADEGVTDHHLNTVHAALAAQGEAMVAALLACLCDTCPRRHMRNAADCLRGLLLHPVLGNHAAGWFTATLKSGSLPGMQDGSLVPEDCERLGSIVLNGGLRGGRLIALLVDFGLVARKENTPDVLLAYEF